MNSFKKLKKIFCLVLNIRKKKQNFANVKEGKVDPLALFSSEKISDFATVALLFLFLINIVQSLTN